MMPHDLPAPPPREGHAPSLHEGGEHLCLVHGSGAEAQAILLPFLEEGRRMGRKVLLVGNVEASALRRALDALDGRPSEDVESGADPEIRPVAACFGEPGDFDRYQAITFVRRELQEALDRGQTGLHLVLDLASLEATGAGMRDLIAFEAGLNLLPGDRPLKLLCLYDRERTSADLTLRALDLHPSHLGEDLVRRPNPFYQPEVEFRTAHAEALLHERLRILARPTATTPPARRPDADALLARVARRIEAEGSSPEGLARIAVEEIGAAVGADGAHFYLVDRSDTQLLSIGSPNDEEEPLRRVRGEGVAGRAWLARRPSWRAHAEADGNGNGHGRSELALPLLGGTVVRGVAEFTADAAFHPDGGFLDHLEPAARMLGEALGRIRAEERLGESKGGLPGLLGTFPDGVVVTDPDGRIRSWNLEASRLLGDSDGQVPVGRLLTDFLPTTARDRFRRALDVTKGTAVGAPPAAVELPLAGAGGRRTRMTLTVTAWEIANEPAFICALREESAEREARMQARLIESVAARAAREAMIVTSADLQWGGPAILYANSAFCRLTGYTESELLGQSFRVLAGPRTSMDDLRGLWERLARGEPASAEFVAYRRDGGDFLMHLEISPVRDDQGKLTHFVGVHSDISGSASADDRVPRADRDALTGLANRTLFDKVLRRSLERVRRNPEQKFAVLFLDLDGFKEVNDSLGHVLGDQLLVSVARRLEEAVRPGDILVRFGGDEFVIVLEYAGGLGDVLAVADRIQDRLARPFRIDSREIVISASIGIALSETGYSTVEEVVRDADSAMYRAKEEGSGQYRIFDRTLREEALSEGRMRTDLQSSLDRGEFRLHYQPLLDLVSGTISGVEALLRWEHPERGLVAATEFIGQAEAMKLILPLGRWVIRESCRQLRDWQDRLPPGIPLSLSLNLSSRELLDPRAREWFEESLMETGIDPSMLRIEVPESFFLRPRAEIEAALRPIRDLGVRIGIDEFGSGTVSLGQLPRFPVDFIKIDRQFVADLPRKEGGNGRAVRAILAVANSLGLDVVAPGVETTLQEELLRELACPKAQGYLFSAPVDAEKAGRLLEAGRLGPRA